MNWTNSSLPVSFIFILINDLLQRFYTVEIYNLKKLIILVNGGRNLITRVSSDSEVIIPFDQVFRNLNQDPNTSQSDASNYCGCGWPEHMLMPKGDKHGFLMDLFVMITDYQIDQVIINL